MAGGKQTPRQKMIGILYLVLLGLVALNVSDSILEAFKTLTDSLQTSAANVQGSVDATITAFETTKLKEEPERAKPIYDKAMQARKLTQELDAYVIGLKKLLEAEGGGYNEETGDLRKRDDLDISARLMINQGRGAELKKRVNETRQKLLLLLDEKERENVNFSLQAVDPKRRGLTKKTWEEASFGDGIPLTAALTALAKIEADTKNAESEMVKKILGKMDMAVVNLDQFAAVAVAPTSYVIQGQPYTAEVFLTAFDSKLNSTVSVNGSPLQVKDGKGIYTVGSTSGEGIKKWFGTIRVKQTDGSFKEYRTPEQSYQVAKPSATVSPTKMNVFYIGLPNPVDISAPGIAKDKIRINVSGGTSTGSNGQYNINVSGAPGSTATVSVSAEVNGKMQNFGSSEFRVKRIPDPKARFAGKSTGSVSAVILKNTPNLFAVLDDFVYDAKFNITRFDLIILKPRQDAITLQGNNSALTPAMKAAMAGVTPNTRIFFENIVAVGPDGSQRPLDAISFKAN